MLQGEHSAFCSPLFLSGESQTLFNWKAAVIALAATGLALALAFRLFAWDLGGPAPVAEDSTNQNQDVSFWDLLRWLPYMFLLYGIVMFVWKGAYTWIPTYIKETYGMTAGKAIIFSIILPVIGIFSNYIMGKLSDRLGRPLNAVHRFCFPDCLFRFYVSRSENTSHTPACYFRFLY